MLREVLPTIEDVQRIPDINAIQAVTVDERRKALDVGREIRKFILGFDNNSHCETDELGRTYTFLLSPLTLDLQLGKFVKTQYLLEHLRYESPEFSKREEFHIVARTPSWNEDDGHYIRDSFWDVGLTGVGLNTEFTKNSEFVDINEKMITYYEYDQEDEKEEPRSFNWGRNETEFVDAQSLTKLLNHLKASTFLNLDDDHSEN